MPALAWARPGTDNGSMPSEHLSLPADTDLFLDTLAAVAPGTALRDGLERILRGGTGALVVIGHDATIESMSGGGFILNVEFTATRLRELAKMDGAIILSEDASTIVSAGVHLLPDGSLPTEESGTRHRTADRVSQQSRFSVLSVSGSMKTIAIYVDGHRHVLEGSTAILSRANQALATLERYKSRLDEVSATLSALEVEDLVTIRDVAIVAQRLEMVRRIAAEIADYAIELGNDGRLVSLQHAELIAGVDQDRVLTVGDYLPDAAINSEAVAESLLVLDSLSASELLDLALLANAVGLDGSAEGLDTSCTPRGYRLLARVPRLPEYVIERLVEHFETLQRLLAASIDELRAVEGVGDTRARSIRESLARMAESTLSERYI